MRCRVGKCKAEACRIYPAFKSGAGVSPKYQCEKGHTFYVAETP